MKIFRIQQLEEEYNTNKMEFLIENPTKTEKDYIINQIDLFTNQELEIQRKSSFSDDEVYNECKKNERYKDAVKRNFSKEKFLDPFLKNEFKIFRQKYNPERDNSDSLKLKFYKTKLNNYVELKKQTNKSLLFKGTNLNIKDRYRILNKVLDFDKKVHPLNIGELEKYQLLAYILGCDKDNARKLMNGTHDAKDNDLTAYFIDLDLNK